MNDPTNDNEIDALLVLLHDGGWKDFHRALTALVAERDKAKSDFSAAWGERSEFAKRIDEADGAIFAVVAERNALRKRVAELESRPPASDLRERDEAMTRWMDQVTAMLCHSMTHSHDAKQELVTRCDKAIATMRKGEA